MSNITPFPVGGISGVSNGNKDSVFQRDIGLVLGDVEKRTFQFVESIFVDEKDAEALEIMGILAQFWVTSYSKINSGEIRDILSLHEMYDYIAEKGEKGLLIEGLLNRVYFLMMRAYFAACNDISYGMPVTNEELLDYTECITAISLLPPEKRKKFIKLINNEDILPRQINLNVYNKSIEVRLQQFVSNQEQMLKSFKSKTC
jgi:hypothetical protein